MLRIPSLQLLADATGASADAGTADAGTGAADLSARLAEMGVPQDRIDRRRAALSRKAQPAAAPETEAPVAEPSADAAPEAGEAPAAETETEQPKRLTWDEIMADPEYNKAMQETMQKRLRSSKAGLERLEKLGPVLDVLSNYYNIDNTDPANLDVDALVKAVVNDDNYYEDRALAEGRTVDEVREESAKARQQRDLEEQTRRQRFDTAWQQGEAFKSIIPDFDMSRELENPGFRAMVMGFGMPVEDAWFAVHHREREQALREQITRQATEDAARAVAAGQKRPSENGAVPQGASTTEFNVRDKSYRDRIKREVELAKARGEKVYPPGYYPRQ